MRGARARRAAAAVVAVLAVSVLLGGCRTIRGTIATRRALEEAGYTDVKVSPYGGSIDHLEVRVTPASSDGGPEGQANQAAGIVWTVFPLRFDHLTVVVDTPEGGVAQVYSHSDMTRTFGPRDPALDRRRMSGELAQVAVRFTAGFVAVWVVFIGGSALGVVVLVRSHRRRSAARPMPWPPPAPNWGLR